MDKRWQSELFDVRRHQVARATREGQVSGEGCAWFSGDLPDVVFACWKTKMSACVAGAYWLPLAERGVVLWLPVNVGLCATLSGSLSLPVCLPLCLCPPICLTLSVSVSLSPCLSVFLCLCLSLSVCLSVCLSVRPSVRLSVCLTVCLPLSFLLPLFSTFL